MKTSLLEAVEIHNNNKHTTTLFKPIDLINNTDEDIYNNVVENIKINDLEEDDLKLGSHILIKNNCAKEGKLLVTRKIKLRELKIIGTIVENYSNGIYAIRIDETQNNFIEGEELICENKHFLLIKDNEWEIIKNKIIYERKNDQTENNKSKTKKKKNSKNKRREKKKIKKERKTK